MAQDFYGQEVFLESSVIPKLIERMIHRSIVLVRPGKKSGAFEVQSRDVEMPAIQDGEVRIAVTHSGVNFADALAGEGKYHDAPKAPSIIGYEVVGKVIESKSYNFAKGDCVVAMTRFGGFQNLVTLPDAQISKVPAGLPEGEVLGFAVQGTTAHYAAYELANIQAGDAVLVQAAAGGVGSLLIQLAKARRAHVTAVVGSAEKVAYVKTLGADDVFISSEIPLKRMYDRDWDVIFDSVGGASLRLGIKSLKAGGRIVSFGVASFSGRSLFGVLQTVLGFGIFSPIQFLSPSKSLMGINILKLVDQKPETVQHNMRAILELSETLNLKVSVDTEYSENEMDKALDRLRSRKSMGKVLIKWLQ